MPETHITQLSQCSTIKTNYFTLTISNNHVRHDRTIMQNKRWLLKNYGNRRSFFQIIRLIRNQNARSTRSCTKFTKIYMETWNTRPDHIRSRHQLPSHSNQRILRLTRHSASTNDRISSSNWRFIRARNSHNKANVSRIRTKSCKRRL